MTAKLVTLQGESYYSTISITVSLPLAQRIDALIARCPTPDNQLLVAVLEAGLLAIEADADRTVLGGAA